MDHENLTIAHPDRTEDAGGVIKPKNQNRLVIESHLPYRFVHLANLIQNFTNYKYDVRGLKEKYDINLRELRVICMIGLKAPVSPAMVATLTGIDRATVTRAINLLKEKQYIISHKNSRDGRSKFLSLTRTGAELCDVYIPKLIALGNSFDRVLTAEELTSLHAILDKIEREVIPLEM